jgi:hypothetical protein
MGPSAGESCPVRPQVWSFSASGAGSIPSNAFGPIADHFLSRDYVDLVFVVTELAPDLGVMLAEHRRRAFQPVVDARVSEGRALLVNWD